MWTVQGRLVNSRSGVRFSSRALKFQAFSALGTLRILLGAFNEDRLRTLRTRRVLSSDGAVLFDVEEGHEDPRVEGAIDEVNSEYLDLLLDLTGDTYMGSAAIRLG